MRKEPVEFGTDEELLAYVEAELEKGMMEGSTWERKGRSSAGGYWWTIDPGTVPDAGFHEYGLSSTPDRTVLYLSYGNTDVGIGGPHQMLLRSLVITPDSLRMKGLGELVRYVLGRPGEYPPNVWGLT